MAKTQLMEYTPNLFEVAINTDEPLDRKELGTFKDSLRAPIHRWFTYPAGFSFKAVEHALQVFKIKEGMTVFDPFAGTGTTNIAAKQKGINSFGIEAHPFVYRVARTKLFWEFNYPELVKNIDTLVNQIEDTINDTNLSAIEVGNIFPELVCKCYSAEKLAKLYLMREAVLSLDDEHFKDFARVALTYLLRSAADVQTGWPYIAPKKEKTSLRSNGRDDVSNLLKKQLYSMCGDLQTVVQKTPKIGNATIINGDSRERHEQIQPESIDLSFTSPPYLNNFDYADRTRLETYFWGEASNWSDITKNVRTKLMMSATTQINRSDYDKTNFLTPDFWETCPKLANELQEKTAKLSELRLVKGGKKSYDIMVGGYFNDMLRTMRETFRILKSGSSFLLILGDSAPYGVYIPTDEYLGEIGKAVGFADYEIEILRTRGGKWKANPQRHSVELRESILTLRKA